MTRIFINILASILLNISPVLAKESKVGYTDVRRTMTKMFAYHVDFKSFTPDLAQRTVKIYLEQFDPRCEYFLQDEVSSFHNLSTTDAAGIVSDYYHDKYPVFLSINEKIEIAVKRHRAIRQKVWQAFIDGNLSDNGYQESPGHVADEKALEARIQARYGQILKHYEKRAGGELTRQSREKIAKKLEKKIVWYESAHVGKWAAEQHVSVSVLKAMARSLDAHTAYYTPDEARELRTALKKQFEGIGVVLREAEDGIVVVDLISGSPADRSGKIQVGDYLTAIENEPITDLSFEEVLDALKGDRSKSKSLTLKRGENKTIRVSLRPENIVLQEDRASYTVEKYGDGVILKIDLPGFYDSGDGVDAEADLKRILKEVSAMGPIHGLVIDMRTNSGGFLTQAVKIGSLFISKGIVVISKYSDGEVRYMRDLQYRNVFQGPIVLLTSKASASAAEILAQALQDYGVALVVGDERTYGKGSMQYQTVTSDNADAYFKVTVGRYYTVSGRSTQIQGVKADIVVPTIYSSLQIGEQYLEYPLRADNLDFSRVGKGDTELDRHLAPFFQMKEVEWREMLPELRRNSAARISNDPGYRCFLERAQNREFSSIKESCGDVDYQMRESVNIIKDMIEIRASRS